MLYTGNRYDEEIYSTLAVKALGKGSEMLQIRSIMAQSEHKIVQAPPVLNASKYPAVDSIKWYFKS